MTDATPTHPWSPVPFRPLANRWLQGLATVAIDLSAAPPLVEATDGGPQALAGALAAPESEPFLRHWLPVAVQQVNQEFFRFEITTLGEEDEPAVHSLADLAEVTTNLPWGLAENRYNRKLVLLLAMGDVGGARLELPYSGKSADLVSGTAQVFPAYAESKVTGAEGLGGSLIVMHALGPSFR